MTRQQAKELLPIIKAYSEGADIEVREAYSTDRWVNCHHPSFNDEPKHYRIKPPEPKLRPWRPEEVPVGALLRIHSGEEFIIMGRVAYVGIGAYQSTRGVVKISESNKVTGGWQAYETVGCTYSLDHGKTWQPCGVME